MAPAHRAYVAECQHTVGEYATVLVHDTKVLEYLLLYYYALQQHVLYLVHSWYQVQIVREWYEYVSTVWTTTKGPQHKSLPQFVCFMLMCRCIRT